MVRDRPETEIAYAHSFQAHYDTTIKRLLIFSFFGFMGMAGEKAFLAVFAFYVLGHLLLVMRFHVGSSTAEADEFREFLPEWMRQLKVRVLKGSYRERSVGHSGFVFAQPINAIHKKDETAYLRARSAFVHEMAHAKFSDFSTLITLLYFGIASTLLLVILFTQFAPLISTSAQVLTADVNSTGGAHGTATSRLILATYVLLFIALAAFVRLILNTLHRREYRADFFAAQFVGVDDYIKALEQRMQSERATRFQPELSKRSEHLSSSKVDLSLIKDGVFLGIVLIGAIWSVFGLMFAYNQMSEAYEDGILFRIIGDPQNVLLVGPIFPLFFLSNLKWKARNLSAPIRSMLKLDIGISIGIFVMCFLPLAAYSTNAAAITDDDRLRYAIENAWQAKLIVFVATPAVLTFVFAFFAFLILCVVSVICVMLAGKKSQIVTPVDVLVSHKLVSIPPAFMAFTLPLIITLLLPS